MQHGRKEQWQQWETAVQIVSTAERKDSDECLCSAHFPSIYSVRDHSPWNGMTHIYVDCSYVS